MNLESAEKRVELSDLSIYYKWKSIKKSQRNNKFKMSAPTWDEDWNGLICLIIYQVFKTILNIPTRSMEN